MKYKLKVGDIVLVKESFIGNPKNSIGFIYETYTDFDDTTNNGVSIILENGCDLGGFSFEEQEKYVDFIKTSGLNYEFKNITKLREDFNKIIKTVF